MINAQEKYRRKKMFREFVAEHQKQQKSQNKINWAFAIVVGVAIGLLAFSTLAATVSTAATVIGA